MQRSRANSLCSWDKVVNAGRFVPLQTAPKGVPPGTGQVFPSQAKRGVPHSLTLLNWPNPFAPPRRKRQERENKTCLTLGKRDWQCSCGFGFCPFSFRRYHLLMVYVLCFSAVCIFANCPFGKVFTQKGKVRKKVWSFVFLHFSSVCLGAFFCSFPRAQTYWRFRLKLSCRGLTLSTHHRERRVCGCVQK